MKKYILIVLVLVLTLSLCACTTQNPNAPAEDIPDRFVEIDEDLNGYAPDIDSGKVNTNRSTYVVDRHSRIVYLYHYDGGSQGSGSDFIMLYDSDGVTPLRYTGELPTD